MARKIYCKCNSCKFHEDEDICAAKKIIIGEDGCCVSYKKGFAYYFWLVWDKLNNSNMILPYDLDEDLRIGLYYVMDCYDLQYSYTCHGSWEWICLHTKDSEEGLTTEKIKEKEINMDKLMYHYDRFMKGILPNSDMSKDKKESIIQEYGWLSPTGVFTESPWGSHDESAEAIVSHKKWTEEFNEWVKTKHTCELGIARDFLQQVKGYCLIHDPGNSGYIVTNLKELTKKQKEFLYGYFYDMGNKLRAESYLEE